jgi:tRNA (mo5U34)-methyltransferase
MSGFNVLILPRWLRLGSADVDLTPLQKLITGTPLESLGPFLEPQYLEQIRHGDFPKWRKLLAGLPELSASSVCLGPTVSLGDKTDLETSALAALELQLREFNPWRKGPFRLFGIEIDSEWRCDMKWSRLQQAIAPLSGRTVLDVGAGNGYYGFRMLEAGADLVIGIDPHIAYVAQFWAIKHFLPALPTFVLPMALEALPLRLACFDTVFSMGVIYHRRSPIDHLLLLKNSLRPGGELVIETIYVDGAEGYCLTPASKYARMANVWFLPSIATLLQWLTRCGFEDCRVIDQSTTTFSEQRKTAWMPFDSLSDALDPDDPHITIEGLPAPKRVVVTARCS